MTVPIACFHAFGDSLHDNPSKFHIATVFVVSYSLFLFTVAYMSSNYCCRHNTVTYDDEILKKGSQSQHAPTKRAVVFEV